LETIFQANFLVSTEETKPNTTKALVCFYQLKDPKMLVICSQAGVFIVANTVAFLEKLDELLPRDLVKYTCMPILLYSSEMLNLSKSHLNSLDFVANRFLIKLFNLTSIIRKL